MRRIVYLGLGSNLGDREASIREALRRLDGTPGIEVEAVSSILETAPIGPIEQEMFLNAVARVRTILNPEGLLDACLTVERDMGRVRTVRWGPRPIDIDILVYGDESYTSARLTIPHPEIANRAFVLMPLHELAPDLVLPDGRAIADLLAGL